MAVLTVIAIAVFAHGLVSKRLRTTIVTAPMVFVAIGLLTGSQALGVATVDLGSAEVIILAELTLSIMLFSDAVRVDPSMVRSFIGIPARMLGIGLPLSIAAGTAVARLVFDLPWSEAALLGSILAATDAALGQAVLADHSVPARIRSSLNVESGLNDGLALPAVTLFIAVTLAEAEADAEPAAYWIRFVAEQIGFGVLAGAVIGAGAGWLLLRARRAGWVDGINAQLSALALVGLAYLSAEGLGGNAFIAAFIAGASFRLVGGHQAEHLTEFTEDSGQLLASITFVVFGNALLGPTLDDLTLAIAVFVVAALTVTRMVPIGLSLSGTGLRTPTIAFLGWFGPRGLASILFALIVLEETGSDVDDQLFVVVSWTVLASVVLHGASASWSARRYGVWYERHRDAVHEEHEPAEGPMDDDEVRPRIRWMPRTGGRR
ncbi:MAG: cation:proton antiporter [Acidimicrobiales bacterium]|nr:cation:proton antiporter [Acidimicrobiales bacterium]